MTASYSPKLLPLFTNSIKISAAFLLALSTFKIIYPIAFTLFLTISRSISLEYTLNSLRIGSKFFSSATFTKMSIFSSLT